MVVALIALTGLVTLGSLTVLSVQGGIATVGHDRHKSVALYAAESGAAAAMDFLRRNVKASPLYFSEYIEPDNVNPQKPTAIVGNQALPRTPGNLFSNDMNAWYEVEILNNLDDRDFATGGDFDGHVIIRATGHAANGAMAQVEWHVSAAAGQRQGRPCPSYGQKNMAEDGAGVNTCLENVVATDVATYAPSSP